MDHWAKLGTLSTFGLFIVGVINLFLVQRQQSSVAAQGVSAKSSMHVYPLTWIFIGCLTLAGIFNALPALMAWGKRSTRIEILAPLQNTDVPYKRNVIGCVRPAGSQQIEVFILSHDEKWYPQREPEFDGAVWSVDCQFGQQSARGPYKIAAILLDHRINEPVSILPSGRAKSAIITAFRK